LVEVFVGTRVEIHFIVIALLLQFGWLTSFSHYAGACEALLIALRHANSAGDNFKVPV
jgi:hypothetical protein